VAVGVIVTVTVMKPSEVVTGPLVTVLLLIWLLLLLAALEEVDAPVP